MAATRVAKKLLQVICINLSYSQFP